MFLQTRERERERASTYIILQVFFWEEEALDCEGDEVSALFWPVAIIILVKKKSFGKEGRLFVCCVHVVRSTDSC